MGLILIVDDQAIIREPIAACLRAEGYECLSAGNGREALTLVRERSPDLILLDLHMPEMGGLEFLRALRHLEGGERIPVFLLTSEGSKDAVVVAAKLGAREYFLKSSFSFKEFLARVQSHLKGVADASGASGPAVSESAKPGNAEAQAKSNAPVEIPKLLTREECLLRAKTAVEGKTLLGIVAQVNSLATSPRGDVTQLAGLIAQDPMLSARVLQVANSAAYASSRGTVTSISEAIKNVGSTAVRNITATVGVFEATSGSSAEESKMIRCWQHSFAVARMSELLASSGNSVDSGSAYLAGLCHDLGEVLYYARFGSEHQQVVELVAATGKKAEDVEREVLGATRQELMGIIFKDLGLPDAIRRPIEAFHACARGGKTNDPVARVLQLAEWFANGALLASSGSSTVAPITRAACKLATGSDQVVAPDAAMLRSEVFVLTTLLARLSRSAEAELTRPIFDGTTARIWLARQPGFAAFDPIAAALGSMAEVHVQEKLPTMEEANGIDGLVVVAKVQSAGGFGGQDILKAAARRNRPALPVMWMVGAMENGVVKSELTPVVHPVEISAIAKFVQEAAVAIKALAA